MSAIKNPSRPVGRASPRAADGRTSKPPTTATVFPSLSFDPSRTVLSVQEVARKLRISEQHVIDLIDEGKLRGVNIAGKGASGRRFYRIPAEVYYAYLEANTL
jgi:excisionase family DNA binding protein